MTPYNIPAPNNPPTVIVGGPYNVDEGNSIDVSASGSDLDGWDNLGFLQQLGVIPPLGPPAKEIETGSVSLDSWLAMALIR
ncbi:MAG: hypothetical protein ACE5PV_23820 [Candidatus Poribacteria bacterium]